MFSLKRRRAISRAWPLPLIIVACAPAAPAQDVITVDPIGGRTAWPMFLRGPQHTGHNPTETILSTSTVGALRRRWREHTHPIFRSSPVVANGIVFVGSTDNNLYAFAAGAGKPLWTGRTAGPIYNSAAWSNGLVFVSSSDGNLHAYDATTGQSRWNASLGGAGASPTIANGVIFVGASVKSVGGANYIYAVDAATGNRLWSDGPFGFATPNYPLSAAVENQNLYFSFYNLFLWLYNVDGSGELAQAISCTSSPSVQNGLVYVGWGNSLAALNASAFGIVWTGGTGATIYSSPAIANGMVYVGSSDNKLYAFNASTGAPIWSAATAGPVNSSPAVANGVVYVGSDDGKLYAFNAATGAQLWSGTTGGPVESSPAVVDGVVYVGSEDGFLYAFSLPPDATR